MLPFTNLSPDPENEFFADGMTDELINALAKVEGLHVVSRTTAFAFKGTTTTSAPSAAGSRSARYWRAACAGPAAPPTHRPAQWTSTRFHLWSETFDRELEDVFAIQDEVSRAIVADPAGPAARIEPVHPGAARHDRPRGLYPDSRDAVLEPPLRRRPPPLGGPPGGSAGAGPHLRPGSRRAGRQPRPARLLLHSATGRGLRRRQAPALRAREIEPALAEARPALAYVAMYHDWDWDAAEREFQDALRLNPGYATAHQWYGNFESILGRVDGALASFQRGVALDPLGAIRHAALGWGYYFARQYESALDQCRRAVESTRNCRSRTTGSPW